jgi:hypothetical protein
MAKRFIDTNLFNDEWFSDLSKDSKLFFIYYITNCDHAGIFKFNKKLCEFQTGIKNFELIFKELGNRLVTLNDGIFFMPAYLKFQYPDFPKSKVKQQISAVKLLENQGVTLDKLNTYLSVSKELDNYYEYVNVNVNEKEKGVKGEKHKPNLEEVKKYCFERNRGVDPDKFWNYYEANGWKIGKNPMKNWQAAVRTWEKNSENQEIKPTFKTGNLL